jgi:hypothetical protein
MVGVVVEEIGLFGVLEEAEGVVGAIAWVVALFLLLLFFPFVDQVCLLSLILIFDLFLLPIL